MGIVIINGKRYDSVTGLMITDNSNHVVANANTDSKRHNDDTPDWIASYVDEVGTRNVTATSSRQPTRTEQQADSAADLQTDQSIVDQVVESSHATTRAATRSMRRGVQASHTLNRRFVKKPLAENGKYAESLAIHELKQAKQAKKVVSPINIPESTQLDAATRADQDFIPMLTRRQAEGLNQLTRQQTAHTPQTSTRQTATNQPASTAHNISVKRTAASSNTTKPVAHTATARPAVHLVAPNRSEPTNDDILNERLSQLSKILQNAQELDQQQNGKSVQHRDNSTSSSNSSNTQAKQKSKATKRHRRKFRAPAIFATAGAVAIIAAISVYVAMPSISVKLAANKAGIDAKNPYTPAGFTIDGEVAYQAGRVTINYRSKNGGDGYSVTQEQDSNATDTSLQQEAARRNNGSYQTVQLGDKTAYRYRDIVTWVDNGMKYTINTNDYLDSDQITDIANSL